ncbi:MAG: family 20 glycosylhydrolase [Mucinivorans sp.]
MKKLGFLLLAVTLMGSCAKKDVLSTMPTIIPEPVSIRFTDPGGYVSVAMISYDRNDAVMVSLAKRFSYAMSLPPDGTGQAISIDLDTTLTHAEGYTIIADKSGVSVRGKDYAGLYYGLVSLMQLYEQGRVPYVQVEDYPRFAWRGVMLDVARHFQPKQKVMEFIDLISLYKINKFHWHLTDGIGWRVAIDHYPELTAKGGWRKEGRKEAPWVGLNVNAEPGDSLYGGFYTKSDIREIVSYAASHYIEIIPEIEMPGHSEAVSFIYPEYFCSSAAPGGGVYCAGKDSTYIFLENIISEVAELFPSKYIHIGGDEVGKGQWMACKDCQKRMRSEKLTSGEQLQSYFTHRIETHVNSLGKRLMGWDEIAQGGLASTATVMSWTGFQSGIDAANAGHDVVMCPLDYVYFDHYQGYHDSEPQAWGGYNGLRRVYDFPVIPKGIAPDKERFVLGGQANLWTENISSYDHITYMLLPRLAALSEVLWSPNNVRNWDHFAAKMAREFDFYDRQGLTYSGSSLTPQLTMHGGTLSLSSELGIFPIYYSLDGTEPTTMYKEPLILNKDVTLRARTMRTNAAGQEVQIGYEVRQEHLNNKATGSKVIYGSPYSQQYSGGGPTALVDNRLAIKRGDDPLWQGFENCNILLTVDLKNDELISKVVLRFFEHIGSTSVMQPTALEVDISPDGHTFTNVFKAEYPVAMENFNAFTREYPIEFGATRARYVRIKARNMGPLPQGHPRAGSPSWLFMDEVVIL